MNPLTETIRKYIAWSYYLFLFILPFIWTPKTSELFEFPKMLTVYVFTVVIGALWLWRMILDRHVILAKTFLDIPLLLFLASQIISTMFSIDPHTSWWGYYSRFHGGLISTLCYILLYYAAVSNLLKSEVATLLRLILISTALTTFYAFLEHFGHSFSCLMITGTFTVDCWIQDVQSRVFGTFGQPNWLAAYIITLFFIPLRSILPKKNALSIVLSALYCVLLFLTLIFTRSKSGILGLALGLIVFASLSLVLAKGHRKNSSVILLSVFALFTILFTTFGQGIIPQFDSLRARFFNPSPTNTPSSQPENRNSSPPSGPALEVGGTESSKIREIVWTGALDLWRRYPLFGSGVETFAYGYYNVRPVSHNLVSEWDFLYNKAHNEFLNFLSTTGLFGLASYLSIMFVYFFWSLKIILHTRVGAGFQEWAPAGGPPPSRGWDRRTHNSEAEPTYLLIAFLSGYLALAVSNFFGFSTVPVALLFFLFPAFAHIIAKSPIQSAPSSPPKTVTFSQLPVNQGIALFFVLLGTGYLLFNIFNRYRADTLYNQGKQALEGGELVNAITNLKSAYTVVPEPLYSDALSLAVAQAAVAYAGEGKKTEANQLAEQAAALSQLTLQKNKVHLNFYKSQVRVYVTLTAINPNYVKKAQQSLVAGLKLAPTDAKLWYNLGLLYDQLGDSATAINLYQKTIELKPNYEAARMSLAALYEASEAAKTKEQYDYILKYVNPNNETAKEKINQ